MFEKLQRGVIRPMKIIENQEPARPLSTDELTGECVPHHARQLRGVESGKRGLACGHPEYYAQGIAEHRATVSRHDPRSGLRTWVADPRFSQGYTALQNRPGLLIETHMLKDYPTRVDSALKLVTNTLGWLNTDPGRLRGLVLAADQATATPEFRATPFPLDFELAPDSTTVAFAGVTYETVTSEVTGGEWNHFTG